MTPHKTGSTTTPDAPRATASPRTFGPQGPTLGDLSDAYLQDYQVRQFRSHSTAAPLLPSRRSPKRQHTGLVRMQCESVASQPLGQDIHHALCVVASLEADHKVIGISHERRPTTKPRSHDLVEPRPGCGPGRRPWAPLSAG